MGLFMRRTCGRNGTFACPRRNVVSTVPLQTLLLLVPLAGCATERLTFDRPVMTTSDLELSSAIAGNPDYAIVTPYCMLDRETFAACMEARGYTIRFQ